MKTCDSVSDLPETISDVRTETDLPAHAMTPAPSQDPSSTSTSPNLDELLQCILEPSSPAPSGSFDEFGSFFDQVVDCQNDLDDLFS